MKGQLKIKNEECRMKVGDDSPEDGNSERNLSEPAPDKARSETTRKVVGVGKGKILRCAQNDK